MKRPWIILLPAAPAFAQPRRPIAEQLAFTPYHGSGIYKTPEAVGLRMIKREFKPVELQ